ncbi:bacteriohopanetetrol glucosamine biosynthesis glycosyltransferase HpnI [Syntrophobacter fumaroxidans]|nr:bacteriohopanetetrol glucosamine biosynthesis glycosyltransferase HpnI [Syntrophobacter fumaroxidans]
MQAPMLTDCVVFFLSLLSLAGCAYYLTCIVAARRFFSRPRSAAPVSAVRPASILIPLCGADFQAYDNYASFCRLDYPEFQLVFGVQDPMDSSIPVVERLKENFPHCDIHLVIDSKAIGTNPKVSNLNNMLAAARHELIVIVDSDIRVEADYLSTLVPELADERIGLVTCLYRAGATPNWTSLLEAVGITGEFAPGVLVADFTEGIRFAFGATMATTKTRLSSIGGFAAIADYLGDDYMLGNLLWREGYEIRLGRPVVETMPPPLSFRSMLNHQIRWSRNIRACRPMGHFGTAITYGTVPALLNFIFFASPFTFLLLGAVAALRLFTGWYVGVRGLRDRILEKNLWLLLPRDLLGFGVWCASLTGWSVEWRGRRYRLQKDGRMLPPGERPEP